MRRQIDRYDVEHQFALGRVEAVAAAGKISQRRAGVDALVPSRERIAKRALDHRGTHNGRRDRVAARRTPTARRGSWCSCRCWAIPICARAPGRSPSAAPRPIACASARAAASWASPPSGSALTTCSSSAWRTWSCGFGFDAGDGGERVANLAPQREVAPAVGAPVDRNVVLVTMAVGVARGVAGRNVKQGGAALAAELDHIGDADGVDRERFFQRGLEVDQPGAMHHRVDLAAAGALRLRETRSSSVMSPQSTMSFSST